MAAEREKTFDRVPFKSIAAAAERGKVLKGFPLKILSKPLKPARDQGYQINEGLQTMVIFQGPGVCWTTPFADMILDWVRKVLE